MPHITNYTHVNPKSLPFFSQEVEICSMGRAGFAPPADLLQTQARANWSAAGGSCSYRRCSSLFDKSTRLLTQQKTIKN